MSMQYVCLDCKKVFKKSIDIWKIEKEQRVCPQCGERMYRAGTAFKAPKKEDTKQWDKVKLLITNGFIFYKNIGVPLKTPREAIAFLENDGKIRINTDNTRNRKSLIGRKKVSK